MRIIFEILKSLIPVQFKLIILKYYFNLKYEDVIFHIGAYVSGVKFEGKNLLRKGVLLKNSKLGYGSYISENSSLRNISIGKFCAIGSNVRNCFGQHPSNVYASIHPAFYSNRGQAGFTYIKKQKFEEHKYVNKDESIVNEIGNDVWIGSDVLIMEGTMIFDGAIIAAGSVVTKDVMPYTIVGGIPAKEISKRFDNDQIKSLLSLKWWNRDNNWIERNAKYFDNVDQLIMLLEDEGHRN